MKKFKIGNRVKRVKHSNGGMKIGDIGTVTWVSGLGYTVKLKEYPFLHSGGNLRIAGSVNCPAIVVKGWDSD